MVSKRLNFDWFINHIRAPVPKSRHRVDDAPILAGPFTTNSSSQIGHGARSILAFEQTRHQHFDIDVRSEPS